MVVRIFIDRKELVGYTEMRLKRSKSNMTGELTVSIFMGWLPEAPFLKDASKGREILVYVGGRLAFTGIVDRRRDTAAQSGEPGTTGDSKSSSNLSIGPNEYTVRLTCRGKTKYLVDSSHGHPTGTMLRPTTRSVFETLVTPWEIEMDWEASTDQLDKVRFRDGGIIAQELYRVAEATSLYMYETREGKLRITDGPGNIIGEDIVLGKNILSFSTEQAEDLERALVVVKGQKIAKEVWGDAAVIRTIAASTIPDTTTLSRTVVQLYGDATPELLNKRIQYESNRRNAASRKIELTVFHLQQSTGEPWDLGTLHNVSIPPAGVNGSFEITDLEYIVTADKTLETKLTLSPPPSRYQGETTAANGLNADGKFLSGVDDNNNGAPLLEAPSEWRNEYPQTRPGYISDLEQYKAGVQPDLFDSASILLGVPSTIAPPVSLSPTTGPQ